MKDGTQVGIVAMFFALMMFGIILTNLRVNDLRSKLDKLNDDQARVVWAECNKELRELQKITAQESIRVNVRLTNVERFVAADGEAERASAAKQGNPPQVPPPLISTGRGPK